MCAAYVDDTLHAGNEEHTKLCETTEKKFKRTTRECNTIDFSDSQIENKAKEF